MDTSSRKGRAFLKNAIFSKDKSWPAFIPKPNSLAKMADALYGATASSPFPLAKPTAYASV